MHWYLINYFNNNNNNTEIRMIRHRCNCYFSKIVRQFINVIGGRTVINVFYSIRSTMSLIYDLEKRQCGPKKSSKKWGPKNIR